MDNSNHNIPEETPEVRPDAGVGAAEPEASGPDAQAAPGADAQAVPGADAQAELTVDHGRYAEPEIEDDEDDAPTEWVPSRFEKRIHAIPEKQWNLYQTIGGTLIGAFTVFALFFGGEGINPLFLVAIVLALLVPNMLEDRGRRKLRRGRLVMIIVMLIGIAGMAVYTGVTQGWSFFAKK